MGIPVLTKKGKKISNNLYTHLIKNLDLRSPTYLCINLKAWKVDVSSFWRDKLMENRNQANLCLQFARCSECGRSPSYILLVFQILCFETLHFKFLLMLALQTKERLPRCFVKVVSLFEVLKCCYLG